MEKKPPRAAPKDAIAAIATATGRGGIGVVRISGNDLLPLALQLGAKRPVPRLATLVSFAAANGSSIDQGLLLYFPAPHSFTGEDVLELQAHGGPVVLQMLLRRCLELGARLAEPGEFTRRAYLNDKLDLAQAEAVADLIAASSEQAARAAQRSLSGEFSLAVDSLVAALIELRTLVEASLDFSDEDIDVIDDAALRLQRLLAQLSDLGARARQGALLRSGLQVVLAGRPNVGKSSLLNRLAGEERAMVTPIAGTTRDALREAIQVEGIPLHIIDTAGLRDSEDPLEQLGIARTWAEISRADIVLQVVDANCGITAADREIAAQLPQLVPRLLIENKSDLTATAPRRSEADGQVSLRLSAKTGAGMDLLRSELLRIAGWSGHGEDVILARSRHLQALAGAQQHLQRAALELGRLELAAEELRLAQEALSEITGRFTADDLLGEIFSRFCLGK